MLAMSRRATYRSTEDRSPRKVRSNSVAKDDLMAIPSGRPFDEWNFFFAGLSTSIHFECHDRQRGPSRRPIVRGSRSGVDPSDSRVCW